MQEQAMSAPFPRDQFVAWQLASGRYPSSDALVEAALRVLQAGDAEADHSETPPNGEADALPQAPSTHKHIWDIAEELCSAIADEELTCLPPDGAAQGEHDV
jgi:Arc/MetJ-type ribon-helix-helix transcriptional regulator